MTEKRSHALYTPEMLGLAVSLAEYPLDAAMTHSGKARSQVCGSEIELTCTADDEGRIERLGLRARACAVGQSAAALFARSAIGRDDTSLRSAHTAIERWLAGDGPAPDWPGMEVLAPALDHPGRHEAILLPWKAALAALCKPQTAR